ncbi:MAG: papain-like cysteine protease family protein [Pseudomonadota bacterium]
MTYEVKGMTLIPQQKSMSCWYASARMLLQWRMDKAQQSLAHLVPPELDAECQKIRDSNNGITNVGLIAMAKRLGLKTVPPMTPQADLVHHWLSRYGPLWVNGVGHITVIAGIRKMGGTHQVKVYDPSPVSKGRVNWRDYVSWYLNDTWSGRDTSAGAQTIFLRCP